MWNRVALLATGVAFGWTLVHLACAPRAELGRLRVRLTLSLLAAAVVIVLLGWYDPASGWMGAAVFVVSAAVAYAANAKQVSKEPALALPRGMGQPAEASAQTGVLLVSDTEPRAYGGPAYWAHLMRRRQADGQAVPHWLLRPWAYGRIRSAYGATEAPQPLDEACQALAQLLGDAFRVQHARLAAPPTVRNALGEWADAGLRHVLVIPLGLSTLGQEQCLDQITLSRARERGVRVVLTPAVDLSPWRYDPPESRLQTWMAGRVPAPSGDLPALVKELARLVGQAGAAPAAAVSEASDG